METVLTLAIRVVIAGVLVALFSVIGSVVKPKRLGGIFGGAPSVAIASLTVIAVIDGRSTVATSADGMLIGGLAFVIAAIVGEVGLQRLHASMDSLLIYATWIVVVLIAAALT